MAFRGSGVATALLLALLVGVMAVVQYARYDPLTDTRPAVNFSQHPTAIVFHALGASFAPLIGLLQWSTRLRKRWPAVHRWLGRFYVMICVLIGGMAGLWLSFFAYGGPLVRIGLNIVGVLWLFTTWKAYAAIRAGRVSEHRRWMMRSVALALGGVTLRAYLPILVISSVPFLTAYRIVAWASWVPNLLIAEYLLYRERQGRLRPSR
ncbi:MAG: DUF2306 domain-containing protein [Gemmatimonadaceae bacterium]|nr:DUF2306 domain-containing protein [Gemmatimonadaceae bacterium]